MAPRLRIPYTTRLSEDPFGVLLLISKLNQVASPFLQLSSEIRNKIYGYYFEGTKWLVISDEDMRYLELTAHPPKLHLVCRQIYSEISLWPYSKGIISTNDFTIFEKWLAHRTSTQIDSITRLELHCGTALVDHAVTHLTMPIDRHGTLLRSFPSLTHVFLRVNILSGAQLAEWPYRHYGRINLVDLEQLFEDNVPGVEVTVEYIDWKES